MPETQPEDHLQSRYLPHGASGGGGKGGSYVFTDLAHLDSIIAKWQSIHDRVKANGDELRYAAELVFPPAKDDPSVRQANAYIKSLNAARAHNNKIVTYAKGYIDKLTASRNQYAATEQGNTDRLNNAGGT